MIKWRPGLTKQKDVDAELNYKFLWYDWLENGSIIDTFTVVAETGLTIEASGKVDNNTNIFAKITGGELGKKYRVDCSIVASDGQADSRSIFIEIVDF